MESDNPWHVDSIQTFWFLKCPECNFDSKKEGIFQDHAIENHPKSWELFSKTLNVYKNVVESEILTQIKTEESEEHILKEENINFVNENEDFDDIFTSSGEHPKSMKNCDKITSLENSKSNCEEEFRRKEKFSAIKSDENTEIQLQKIEKELNKDVHEGGHQNCENGKQYQDFRYQCSLCNKSYFYKQSLKKHNNSVHEGKKPYQCTLCGTSFGAKKNLDNHNIQVHQKRELYQCSLCEKSYPYSHSLKIHIETVHEGKKPFQCTHCDAIFTQKSSLDAHIAAIHEKKKPYKCFICNLSFAKIGPRKVHERSKSHQNMIKRNKVQKITNINAEEVKEKETETETNNDAIEGNNTNHENVNLYQCSICDISYPYIQVLKHHIKSVHKGKKPSQSSQNTTDIDLLSSATSIATRPDSHSPIT